MPPSLKMTIFNCRLEYVFPRERKNKQKGFGEIYLKFTVLIILFNFFFLGTDWDPNVSFEHSLGATKCNNICVNVWNFPLFDNFLFIQVTFKNQNVDVYNYDRMIDLG